MKIWGRNDSLTISLRKLVDPCLRFVNDDTIASAVNNNMCLWHWKNRLIRRFMLCFTQAVNTIASVEKVENSVSKSWSNHMFGHLSHEEFISNKRDTCVLVLVFCYHYHRQLQQKSFMNNDRILNCNVFSKI